MRKQHEEYMASTWECLYIRYYSYAFETFPTVDVGAGLLMNDSLEEIANMVSNSLIL